MTISVIVVDDDKDSLEVMSEYLELKDVNVLARASNGKEAFEIFVNNKPEIVLLDVIMPDYDGFYALERIKEHDPNAKVIFVTAASRERTQEKLFETNVDGIIFKPFEMEKLMTAINAVRNGKKWIPNTVRSKT